MSPVRIRRETDLDQMIRRPGLSCGIAVGFSVSWLIGLILWLLFV